MNLYIQEPQKSRLKWSSDYLNKLFSTIFVLKSNSRINLYDYFFCPGLLALFSVSLGSNPIKIRPNRFDFIIYIDHTSWLGISTMRWWAIPRDPVSLHMCRLRGDPRTLAMLCAPSRTPNDVAATGRRWQISAEVSHLRREASRILVIFWGHSFMLGWLMVLTGKYIINSVPSFYIFPSCHMTLALGIKTLFIDRHWCMMVLEYTW
jgi:hypothetical protein